MKRSIFVLCALGVCLPALAQAQASGNFVLICNPPAVSYQFNATQTIALFSCSTNATINGAGFSAMTVSQVFQGTAAKTDSWAVMAGTLANGDQVFFQLTTAATQTGPASDAGTMSYRIVGGTGTVSGISGSGSCIGSGSPSGRGTTQLACAGSYLVR